MQTKHHATSRASSSNRPVWIVVCALLIGMSGCAVSSYPDEDDDVELADDVASNPGGKADGMHEFEADYSLAPHMAAYSQNDPDWSGHLMFCGQGCDGTIGEEGGALTAHAMIASYFGSADDPAEHNVCLTHSDGHTGCSVEWEGCLPADTSYDGWGSGDFGELRDELEAGYPVMAAVRLSGRTQCHHFVVVTGYSGAATTRGDFEILDPTTGTRRSLAAYAGVCGTRQFRGPLPY